MILWAPKLWCDSWVVLCPILMLRGLVSGLVWVLLVVVDEAERWLEVERTIQVKRLLHLRLGHDLHRCACLLLGTSTDVFRVVYCNIAAAATCVWMIRLATLAEQLRILHRSNLLLLQYKLIQVLVVYQSIWFASWMIVIVCSTRLLFTVRFLCWIRCLISCRHWCPIGSDYYFLASLDQLDAISESALRPLTTAARRIVLVLPQHLLLHCRLVKCQLVLS